MEGWKPLEPAGGLGWGLAPTAAIAKCGSGDPDDGRPTTPTTKTCHLGTRSGDRRYERQALRLDGGEGGGEDLFRLGADAEVGEGLGVEDATVAGEDVGGGEN